MRQTFVVKGIFVRGEVVLTGDGHAEQDAGAGFLLNFCCHSRSQQGVLDCSLYQLRSTADLSAAGNYRGGRLLY